MPKKHLHDKFSNKRIIARLDIKGGNVVKPVHTEALRIVGKPRERAELYYKQGIDEIVYMDIVASLYGRNLDFDLLRSVAENIFVPLTVGGGIRTIKDINEALRSGADKVAINTYAIGNPNFLEKAIHEFGSQCIVLSIEAKKQANGHWEAYTDGGRERTGVDVVEWARQGIKRGVGELLITSIDRDGTRQGYDLDLIKRISSLSPIPVIAYGGAGKPEDMGEVIKKARADAVAAASIFHYDLCSVREIKKHLNSIGVYTRTL
ncbi:MAG: imidazole glycerol phosphate synthase cyclase subunit [bacterium]|nr:imidazole glycerol phosphate synthase cyclase subunit [bacterium]